MNGNFLIDNLISYGKINIRMEMHSKDANKYLTHDFEQSCKVKELFVEIAVLISLKVNLFSLKGGIFL